MFKTRLMIIVVFTFTIIGSGLWTPANAAQVGPADQITLNPGGGKLTNGSDGIRFTINSVSGGSGSDSAYSGADAMVYRDTYQYCCSAGAPMLNIGGTLYGQAGPAYSSVRWDSVSVVSTSGATSLGDRTSTVGNSGAVIAYSIDVGGLVYTITRTMNYVYPNDYVTDSYRFVIPEGNTDTVKFYLGGDTAPGSSDSGYGVMLTSPVRSVISLNTLSKIMFGFREVAGSKVFDGATSQSFNAPYSTVASGGDIGYVATESNHDAGLMMQWNLGSTPGTQTAVLQQFATQQGTNLNAGFSSTTTDIDDPITLNVSIVNTELVGVTDLDYSLALPTGLVIGSGAQSNTCNGTVSAVAGTSAISLTGGSVSAASNCIVSFPVVSSSAGTYAISSTSFSDLSVALTNNVGASSLTVENPALGSDLNGDGIDDSTQSNVYTYTSSVTGKTVALAVNDSCTVNSAASVQENSNDTTDGEYKYIDGLMDFDLSCGSAGFTATIEQYYYGVTSTDKLLRKYDPNTQSYLTIETATIEDDTINGNAAVVVTYDVTDGQVLDTDGVEDGNISDPAGLAALDTETITSEFINPPVEGNLAATGANLQFLVILSLSLIMIGGIALLSLEGAGQLGSK